MRKRDKGEPNTRGYQQLRRQVFESSGGVCRYCDRPISLDAFTVDHVEPRAVRGSTIAGNLVAACLSCNARGGYRIYRDVEHKRAVIRERRGL